MAYMMPSTEFLKIKEKQKAWKVDNGLRVHEVTKSDQSPYVKHTAVQILEFKISNLDHEVTKSDQQWF